MLYMDSIGLVAAAVAYCVHGASAVHVATSTKRHSLQGQPCRKIATASIAIDEDSALLVVWMLHLTLIVNIRKLDLVFICMHISVD